MLSLDFRVQLPNKNILKSYLFVGLIITKFEILMLELSPKQILNFASF